MSVPTAVIDQYAAGKDFGGLILMAFDAAALSTEAATDLATAADRKLWPLDDVDDPEALRDFIAGLSQSLELALEARGVFVDAGAQDAVRSSRYLRLQALLAQDDRLPNMH